VYGNLLFVDPLGARLTALFIASEVAVSVLNIAVGFEVDDVVGSRDGKMAFGNAGIPGKSRIG